jgi:hypothetical protein
MHENQVWRRHRSQVFLGPEKNGTLLPPPRTDGVIRSRDRPWKRLAVVGRAAPPARPPESDLRGAARVVRRDRTRHLHIRKEPCLGYVSRETIPNTGFVVG